MSFRRDVRLNPFKQQPVVSKTLTNLSAGEFWFGGSDGEHRDFAEAAFMASWLQHVAVAKPKNRPSHNESSSFKL